MSAAAWTTAQLAAGLQKWRGNRCVDGFGILTYHRVAEPVKGVAGPTWNVAPQRLRYQLDTLLNYGFEAWPLSRLVQAQRASKKIPSNVFAITFDDGYENNYLHAWPILRELNIPATIFLATKYLDSDRPFPFDDWSAAGSSRVPPTSWRPLSTQQCGEMLAGGLIEFGAHTHSHERFLGRCQEFRHDLKLCLSVLRERFQIDHPAFAFPFGDHNAELIDAAKQLQVACCVTTRRRRVKPGHDTHQWGRFNVTHGDTAAVLGAKLSGWYSLLATAGKRLSWPVAALSLAMPVEISNLPECVDHEASKTRMASPIS